MKELHAQEITQEIKICEYKNSFTDEMGADSLEIKTIYHDERL